MKTNHINRNILFRFLILLLTIIVVNAYKECCEEYCLSTDEKWAHLKFLGSKTPYNNNLEEINKNFLMPDCKPVKFWMISRSGSQEPEMESIDNLRKLQPYTNKIVFENYMENESQPKKGEMCQDDLNLIHDWKWNYNISEIYAGSLKISGWNELKKLGIRLSKSLPDLITNKYDNKKFLFRFSNSVPTRGSFNAFVDGIFGDKSHKVNSKEIPDTDLLLRPFDYCPAFKLNTEATLNVTSEVSKFMKMGVYQDLIADVSLRLGFNKEKINNILIEAMYDMCRIDYAADTKNPSAWCSAFTPSQIKIMEYKEDLKSYYENGYGFPLNSKIPCFLMANLLHHFDQNEDTNPNVISYFSNYTIIPLILTALGAYKDPIDLTAENFATNETLNRHWRTSKLTPFGANIVAVKYLCPKESEKYKTKLFLNEKTIELDGCNEGVCEWNFIKNKYKNFAKVNCTESFCSSNSTDQMINISMFLIGMQTIFLFFIFLKI